MRWTPGGTSDDIEDRRDEDDGGGGGGGFGFGGMHIGLGGVVVLFILSLVFKQNFFALLGGGTTALVATTVHRPNPARDEAEKPLVQFVSFVLDDTCRQNAMRVLHAYWSASMVFNTLKSAETTLSRNLLQVTGINRHVNAL